LRAQDDDGDVAVESSGAVVVPPRPTFEPSAAQLKAIDVLERLAASPYPDSAAAADPVAQPQLRPAVLERLLYGLLVIAIIAGLLIPALQASFRGPIAARDAAKAAQIIAGLSDESRVLVAYEWDARRRGELAPLEQAVMGHLAQQHVKFVFVSTDLQGALLSFDARDRLLSPEYGYQKGGRDYLLLGYRPGGELALRQIAQDFPAVLRSDFQGQDATGSVVAADMASGKLLLNSISDFSLLVLLADEPQDVQSWMEQVRSQHPGVPMLLVLPADTTPIVQPYLRMPNVFYLSGKSGALAYEQARGGPNATAAAEASGALPYAVAVFIALALLGAALGATLGATRRKRPA
jgi:hypothetical protein